MHNSKVIDKQNCAWRQPALEIYFSGLDDLSKLGVMMVELVHVSYRNWTAIVIVETKAEDFLPEFFLFILCETEKNLRYWISGNNCSDRTDMRTRSAFVNVLVHELIIRQIFNTFWGLFVQKLDRLVSVAKHGLASFPFVLQNVKDLNAHRLVVIGSICVQSDRDIGVSFSRFKIY